MDQTLKEKYEEYVEKAIDDFSKVDISDVGAKDYTALAKEVNAGWQQLANYDENDRDYREDVERYFDNKILEEKKLEQEKEKQKQERRSKFWENVWKFLCVAVPASLTVWNVRYGWKATQEMQERAIEEDHEDLLPKSPGHKYVPKENPFRVR